MNRIFEPEWVARVVVETLGLGDPVSNIFLNIVVNPEYIWDLAASGKRLTCIMVSARDNVPVCH
jgi:hypothetical protein